MAEKAGGHAAQILAALRPQETTPVPEGSRLTVNETVSRFSFLYERIRNAVDYKDEHLIRKAAILRIMKRQLILETDADVIADHLVRELIGARYLPNGVLNESIIADVGGIVKKYQAVAKIRAGTERHLEWVRGIIAVEIEETLVDASQEKALVTFLYERLADSVRVKGMEMDETERRLQVYVACYRSLMKAEEDMLGFKLLRAYLPEWLRSSEWLLDARPIAERLVAIERRIIERLHHPLASRFQRAVKPWSVSLAILRAALLEKPDASEKLLEKEEDLARSVAHQVEDRYHVAKTKLRRGTARATLYLFVTKMLVALVLEVPLELVWYDHVETRALLINLLFPPILMFFVGLLIRVPDGKNTERIILGVKELLADETIPTREVRAPKTRTGLSGFLFTVAYAVTFVITFGVTVSFLRALDFTPISAAIFLFFLCVVSFFAFRLRQTAREVIVVERKPGLFAVLVDFFSLPVLRAGQWLSRSINRINVFLFIFDFLFEAPFKIFLQILEDWFAFMKEKKEELQ